MTTSYVHYATSALLTIAASTLTTGTAGAQGGGGPSGPTREAQELAVVAINRSLEAAGPGEGGLGLQFHGARGQ